MSYWSKVEGPTSRSTTARPRRAVGRTRSPRLARPATRLRLYRLCSLLLGLVAWMALPGGARADNCSSLTDCYGTVASALAATVGIALVLAMVVSLPSILSSLESLAARSFGAEGADDMARSTSQAATGAAPASPPGGTDLSRAGGTTTPFGAQAAHDERSGLLDRAEMPDAGSPASPASSGQSMARAPLPPPPPDGGYASGSPASAELASARGDFGPTAPAFPGDASPVGGDAARGAGSMDLSRAPHAAPAADAPARMDVSATNLASGGAGQGEATTSGTAGSTDLSRAPLSDAAPPPPPPAPAPPRWTEASATDLSAASGEPGGSRGGTDLSMTAPGGAAPAGAATPLQETSPDATNLQSGARNLAASPGGVEPFSAPATPADPAARAASALPASAEAGGVARGLDAIHPAAGATGPQGVAPDAQSLAASGRPAPGDVTLAAGHGDAGQGAIARGAAAGGEAGRGVSGAADLGASGLSMARSETGMAIVRQVLGQLPNADHASQLAAAAQLASTARLDTAHGLAAASEIAHGLGLDIGAPVDVGDALILPAADGVQALRFWKATGALEVTPLDPLAPTFLHAAGSSIQLDPARGRAAFGRYLLWAESGARHDALASDPDLAAIREASPITIGHTRRADVERVLGGADRGWATHNLFLAYYLAEWPGYLFVFEFDAGEVLRSQGFVAEPTPPAEAPLAPGMTRDAVWARLGPPHETDSWWPFERWRYRLADGRTDVYEFAHGIVRTRFSG